MSVSARPQVWISVAIQISATRAEALARRASASKRPVFQVRSRPSGSKRGSVAASTAAATRPPKRPAMFCCNWLKQPGGLASTSCLRMPATMVVSSAWWRERMTATLAVVSSGLCPS